jgi:hypothetical protein
MKTKTTKAPKTKHGTTHDPGEGIAGGGLF